MTVDLGNEVPSAPDTVDEQPLRDANLQNMWTERSESMEDMLGLALSGGGYRATLLSLGVLAYLVDSGLNRDVRAITSVSGGSYTNAFVAARDLPFHAISTPDEISAFDRDVCDFIGRLTSTNIWLKPRVLGLGLTSAAVLGAGIWLARKPRNMLLRIAVRLLGGIATLWVLDRRGAILNREIWKTILEGDGAATMESLHQVDGEDSLDHIVCATNVADGKFVYLSGRFLYATGLGWQTDAAPKDHLSPVGGLLRRIRRKVARTRWSKFENFKQIPMKRAVDASAALPVVIPPRPFPTGVFERAGMWDVPAELRLVDGGVYDNLSVQWYRSADAMRRNAKERLRAADDTGDRDGEQGELDNYMDDIAPPWVFKPGLLVVVNAGGELKWTNHLPFTTLPILMEPIPVLTEAVELFRVAKIAFTAGTERRLYWLRREFRDRFEKNNPPGGQRSATAATYHPVDEWKGIVVQIDHSPYTVPKALRRYPKHDVQDRARDVRKALGEIGQDWPTRKHQNTSVPAYPHKMKPENAISLMYHGYVSAWANLHTLWDKGGPKIPYKFEEFELRFRCTTP